MPFRVLFVCAGNTCRSPMAAGLCRMFLERFQMGEEVEVASAGLQAFPGGCASREAVALMAEQGIDLSRHCTACLTPAQVRQADLILAMEERQKRILIDLYPEAADKIFILKEYISCPRPELSAEQLSSRYDISDPFGQSPAAYRKCVSELSGAVADLCLDLYRRLRVNRGG